MDVAAKFTCIGVTKRKASGNVDAEFIYDAEFLPVTNGSEENKHFWKWTPAGTIKLTSYLPDAFVPGAEYYVTFSPATTGG